MKTLTKPNRRDALAIIAVATLPLASQFGQASESQQLRKIETISLPDVGRWFANNETKNHRPSDGVQVTVVAWKPGVAVAVVYGPRIPLPGIERSLRLTLTLTIKCFAWSDDRRAFATFAGVEPAAMRGVVNAAIAAAGVAAPFAPLGDLA